MLGLVQERYAILSFRKLSTAWYVHDDVPQHRKFLYNLGAAFRYVPGSLICFSSLVFSTIMTCYSALYYYTGSTSSFSLGDNGAIYFNNHISGSASLIAAVWFAKIAICSAVLLGTAVYIASLLHDKIFIYKNGQIQGRYSSAWALELAKAIDKNQYTSVDMLFNGMVRAPDGVENPLSNLLQSFGLRNGMRPSSLTARFHPNGRPKSSAEIVVLEDGREVAINHNTSGFEIRSPGRRALITYGKEILYTAYNYWGPSRRTPNIAIEMNGRAYNYTLHRPNNVYYLTSWSYRDDHPQLPWCFYRYTYGHSPGTYQMSCYRAKEMSGGVLYMVSSIFHNHKLQLRIERSFMGADIKRCEITEYLPAMGNYNSRYYEEGSSGVVKVGFARYAIDGVGSDGDNIRVPFYREEKGANGRVIYRFDSGNDFSLDPLGNIISPVGSYQFSKGNGPSKRLSSLDYQAIEERQTYRVIDGEGNLRYIFGEGLKRDYFRIATTTPDSEMLRPTITANISAGIIEGSIGQLFSQVRVRVGLPA